MNDRTDLTPDAAEFVVDENEDSMRLDAFLVQRLPQFSRAKIQRALSSSCARVDGKSCKASYRIEAMQRIQFELPQPDSGLLIGEDIPLDIVFEDSHLIGINKPPGMVVHPAKGHWSGTLTAALAFHFSRLSSIGGAARPGIVHRLDRDTSGIILVAKTDDAHSGLATQFEKRTIEKIYLAIVTPPPDRDRDEINLPIGVHPYQREKMAIRSGDKSSRHATTFYELNARQGRFAMLSVAPKTGRTHQIRVHLANSGCPVLCDKLYSGRSQITAREISASESDRVILNRQALHAKSVQFKHPVTGQPMHLEAPLAADIAATWELIVNQAKP